MFVPPPVRRRVGPVGVEPPHAALERHQSEPVAVVQRAEQLADGSLGLGELFSRHRAGHVDRRDDVAAHGDRGMRGTRSEQQHEVSVLTRQLMRHERNADDPASERQKQVQVSGGRAVGQRHLEPAVRAASADLMCGRVGIAEAVAAVGTEAETPRRPRGAWARARDIAKPPGITLAVEDLRVAQRDLAGLAGIDWKDARADQAVSRQLDQRGVALAPHDLLVDRSRLGRVHRLAAQLGVALPEREAREGGLSRKGVVVDPLSQHRPAILEPLLDCHLGNAFIDGDGDRAAQLRDAPAGQRADRLDPSLCGEATGQRGGSDEPSD